MTRLVVDTNVGVVANGKSEQASPRCVLSCLECLEGITRGRARLVLDDGWAILGEYKNQMSSSGQPGPGDAFLLWALQNRAVAERCELVTITADPDRGFVEFPDDPALADFDPADRKFVAVALASASKPRIANATDSDWWHHRAALERHDIAVSFLCSEQVASWEGKSL